MVSVTPAKKGDIGVYVGALGLVTPLHTVAVRSRVEGQLVKIYYKEGQVVNEGDPIADIDPAPFQATLAQAQGQLARDKASLENAQLDSERYKEAFARNAIPKQQFDTQLSSVRQFEGAVKFDQGMVDTAQVQLNYAHISAPISGRVGLRLVDPGNIVRQNDTNPIVVITQLKPITVVFSVAEDYLPQIQKQTRAGNRLKVDALDRAQVNKIATGTLETFDNQIDPGTGTIKLKATFDNEDENLFPNQFVNARLLVETHRGVTLVPTRAIQRGSLGSFVFVINNDTAAAQKITVGPTEGDVTEAEGVEPGALIAMDNFNRLSDGAKVMIRQPGEGGKGPGEPGGGMPGSRGGTNHPSGGGSGQRGGGTNAGGAKAMKGDG
jgi:multidrug efflux system membrane fusion protein